VEERKQTEEAVRKSEERLRRLRIPLLGVIYWNMDGKITDANDRFLEMVGYSREDLTTAGLIWRP
jgi:PAS domain S-box-containing protein